MEVRTAAGASHDGSGNFRTVGVRPGRGIPVRLERGLGAYVGGERIKLQVAHIKLSHSRAFLVRAYLLQTHEMLFDAHWHAFRVFEGVPGRGIYDSEAWPPWVRGLAERRLPSTRLELARSAM